mgnify:CR=1 FL=1|tara:strand:- start:10614 stop:11999 length:1386 start_codon:yes stop_codon:yes gene_type:complete
MTSEIKVNKIVKSSGSTLTIGGCGTAVTLGSGATQSGFGRSGSVDWQTTIKTSTFTAVNGEGYFINTTGGAVTVNLPAGSVGAIIALKDYAQTFDSNNCTISANGSEKIENLTDDLILSTEGVAITLVYADATRGWQSVNSNEVKNSLKYVTASGGNTTATVGDFKVHTFTSPGNFCVSCAGSVGGSNTVEYLVVAGGAGGSTGGGGAGGFRFASPSIAPATYPAKPLAAPASLPVSVQSYPIVVGAGGADGSPTGSSDGGSGGTSSFSSITSAGGGGGSRSGSPQNGVAGGSGGGAGSDGSGATGGAGNTPPVSPAQGNNGGGSPSSCHQAAGGGGGATAVGANGTQNPSPGSGGGVGGNGGAGGGLPNAFGTSGESCGSHYYFSGGGAGGSNVHSGCGSPAGRGSGGLGGGGQGGRTNGQVGCNGTANTGGGGGGSEYDAGSAGNGGSGIVIIRYKFQN